MSITPAPGWWSARAAADDLFLSRELQHAEIVHAAVVAGGGPHLPRTGSRRGRRGAPATGGGYPGLPNLRLLDERFMVIRQAMGVPEVSRRRGGGLPGGVRRGAQGVRRGGGGAAKAPHPGRDRGAVGGGLTHRRASAADEGRLALLREGRRRVPIVLALVAAALASAMASRAASSGSAAMALSWSLMPAMESGALSIIGRPKARRRRPGSSSANSASRNPGLIGLFRLDEVAAEKSQRRAARARSGAPAAPAGSSDTSTPSLATGHAGPHAAIPTRKSQHMARLRPPPTHAPCTAAMTGTGQSCTAAYACWITAR